MEIDYRRKYCHKENSSTSFDRDKQLYMNYLKKYNISKKKRVDRDKFSLVATELMKEISKEIEESKGGVMIRKFGYFFVWKSPKKAKVLWKTPSGRIVAAYNPHYKGHKYRVVFAPVGGTSDMRFLSMDGTFNGTLFANIRKRIRKGFIYKNYVYSLSALLNR